MSVIDFTREREKRAMNTINLSREMRAGDVIDFTRKRGARTRGTINLSRGSPHTHIKAAEAAIIAQIRGVWQRDGLIVYGDDQKIMSALQLRDLMAATSNWVCGDRTVPCGVPLAYARQYLARAGRGWRLPQAPWCLEHATLEEMLA